MLIMNLNYMEFVIRHSSKSYNEIIIVYRLYTKSHILCGTPCTLFWRIRFVATGHCSRHHIIQLL